MSKFLQKALCVALAGLSATGCTVVDHSIAKHRNDEHDAAVNSRFEGAQQAPVAARVAEIDGVWVNKRATSMREEQLPPLFRQAFSVGQADSMTLRAALDRITIETGVRVNIAPDARAEVEGQVIPKGYVFEADLKGFLDQRTSMAGVSWAYRGGAIDVYRFDTKVFRIAASPGQSTLTSTISNRSGNSQTGTSSGTAVAGSSASINSGQDLKYTATLDFWGSLKNDIKNLLTRDGKDASYTVSEATKTVTVTASAAVLNGVETYIKDINAMRTQQVWLDIRAYSVSATSGRDFGVAWAAAYKQLSKDLGGNLTSPTVDTSSLGAITAVLGAGSTSRFANTKLMLNALSTIGSAIVTAEYEQMVPNGETMATSDLSEIAYLAKVQSTAVPNAGSQTSLEPGITSGGVTLTVVPFVVNGDTVQVRGQLDFAKVEKIATDGSGGQQIKTPQRALNALPFSVFLKSGQTYVFAKRDSSNNHLDSGLTGTSLVDLPFGGQRSSSEARKTLVVTVTPRIVNTAVSQ